MTQFRRMAAVLTLAFVLTVIGACSGNGAETAATEDFPHMGVAEMNTLLADSQGKPAIVVFWTTWCPACKQQLPELEKLLAERGDDISILTVSLDEKREALEKFYAGKKPALPTYWGDGELARAYEVQAIPKLVAFDRDGKVVFSRPGAFPLGMLRKLADQIAGN